MDTTTNTTKKGGVLVRVEHVDFSYREQQVLKDITFDIARGDFLAIIGPNGSGKSTLIRLILRLLSPDSGEIYILGRPVRTFFNWDMIGYVPQKATHIDPIFPITVEEVIALGRLSGKKFPRWLDKKDRDAARQAANLVGIGEYVDCRIGALSGGQQQRVFIARAIVNSPEILFLDEPTTGVDVKAQDDFYEMLDNLNRSGVTIVLVTHDIGIVNKHVNKVACLNQTLVFHGTHDEFCSSARVRELIPGDHHLILHRH
ncbi:MAG: metal ABC transporter ATP-binding protein [Dissulfurimicrobium sp.]|uniref:metal ABC transporter ATP-binding protein n=1 Tax=Dissulfurimicrobium TaxID=1769732 RepID=UPI003C752638